MSVANVTARVHEINSRTRNGGSSANSSANFTLHGHTLWEMCR